MGLNNDGYSGVDTEQIALEKVVLVGTQAPNVFPAIKISDTGVSLPKMKISSAGTMFVPSAGWDCSYVDNSWLSHGGIYSLSVGNKINISAGAGGFEWITSGPSRISTPYQDFLCSHAFAVNTRLFQIATTERTHLMGTRLDLQYDEIYIQGNTNFTNNVHVNGSMFVNGELYCSHLTTMQQDNHTSPSDTIKGFLNPAQSYIIFDGASIGAKEVGIKPMENALPHKIGGITATIAANLPVIGQIDVPCLLTFPKGISLLSDAMLHIKPETETIVLNGGNRPIGAGVNKSDFVAPGHVHKFVGPSCGYTSNTGDVYKEAAEAIQSETPGTAKPTTPNGCATLEQVPKMIADAAQNSLIEWAKGIWDDINPFGSIPWI